MKEISQSVSQVMTVLIGLLFASTVSAGNAVVLIEGGQSRSHIVLADDAGVIQRHAAEELATYLEKITGAKVPVATAAASAELGIYLGVLGDAHLRLDAAMRAEAERIEEEGYLLAADPHGLRIVGRTPIGVLFGAYAVLREHGEVRWFAPGEAYEYCPQSPDFRVPQGVRVSNPAFSDNRWPSPAYANWNSKLIDTWDWMVRNGMRFQTTKHRYDAHEEEMAKRGTIIFGGGHAFSLLLSDELFEEHPEYFPLINGQRVRQAVPGKGDRNQPCTSNPAVARIMAENLVAWAKTQPKGARYYIGNNDSQSWCECEPCRQLDPPGEAQQRIVSTRYWLLLNEIARQVRAIDPDFEFGAWGYQNFREPPLGVQPDPQYSIQLCLHQRCYKHSIVDPHCPTNVHFRTLLTEWGKIMPRMTTYEYTNIMPAGEVLYLPMEHAFTKSLKFYHDAGIRGIKAETAPPDGTFGPLWRHRKIEDLWYANWQYFYLLAQFMWDVDADYEAVYEDMGSKFYGAAWPAMKQYRGLLIRAFEETPGCMIYGTPDIALGKCLERPGDEDALLRHLNQAEKLAGDDAALRRKIQLEREWFALSWQKMHREYVAHTQRVMAGAPRTQPIVIDGQLEDADWRTANFITGFIHNADGTQTVVDPQTFVRVLFDRENLYIAMEAMEPTPEQIKTTVQTHDGPVWTDNSVEIFVAPPGSERYLHLIVNADGTVYDALASGQSDSDRRFTSQAEVKTAVLADRWVLEARIPVAPLNTTIGEGEVWQANFARNRVLLDGSVQGGSVANGNYHDRVGFQALTLGGKGLIENGSFEDTVDAARAKRNTAWAFRSELAPARWHFHNQAGVAELVEGDAAAGQHFLRVQSVENKMAIIHQQINLQSPAKLRVSLRARGQGTLSFATFLYDYEPRRFRGSPAVSPEIRVDSKAWTTVETTFDFSGKQLAHLALYLQSAQGLDLDELIIRRD